MQIPALRTTSTPAPKRATAVPISSNETAEAPDGRPAKPLDEATATLLRAAVFAATMPAETTAGRELNFSRMLRSSGFKRDAVRGTITSDPSPVQRMIAFAQELGLVEGNVLARLTQPLRRR